jgi:AcrR family transcriptional regulator
MPDSEVAGTRRARAAETETALKEAAKRVFERIGYLRAKITDITAEADRAAGSFYSHFESKEQLLEALLVDMLEKGHRRAAMPGHSADFSDSAAVRWHIAQYWTFVTGNRAVILALQQASIVSEHFAHRQQEIMAPMYQEMAGHLSHVTAAGGQLPGQPADVSTAMITLMSQYAYAWLAAAQTGPGTRPSAEEAVDMLTAFIMHGIMGPPAPAGSS